MELVYEKSGFNTPVEIGDICTLRDDQKVEIVGIQEPHKPSSTGRVFVILVPDSNKEQRGIRSMAYFPSVIGAKWINREDHSWTNPDLPEVNRGD